MFITSLRIICDYSECFAALCFFFTLFLPFFPLSGSSTARHCPAMWPSDCPAPLLQKTKCCYWPRIDLRPMKTIIFIPSFWATESICLKGNIMLIIEIQLVVMYILIVSLTYLFFFHLDYGLSMGGWPPESCHSAADSVESKLSNHTCGYNRKILFVVGRNELETCWILMYKAGWP